MRECGGDDAKGMVNDNEGVRSMGGRGMLRFIRDGIFVCVVVVVVVDVVLLVVVVLIVAMEVMGVVVLMVVVGIVVRVACVGVVGVLGMLCIGVLEVDCVAVVESLVLGAVFVVEVLGAVFVVEVVEGVELVVGCVVERVVRLILWCVNGRGYFLRCFSLKSVEMKGLSMKILLLIFLIKNFVKEELFCSNANKIKNPERGTFRKRHLVEALYNTVSPADTFPSYLALYL